MFPNGIASIWMNWNQEIYSFSSQQADEEKRLKRLEAEMQTSGIWIVLEGAFYDQKSNCSVTGFHVNIVNFLRYRCICCKP